MLATVASATSAGRIKRRAAEFGIYSSIIQTPHKLTKEGCGYSLRFDDSAREIIEGAARELGVKIRAFYTENLIDSKIAYSRV